MNDTYARMSYPEVEGLKVVQLKDICKELGLSRYSSLNKQGLIDKVWTATNIRRTELLAENVEKIETKTHSEVRRTKFDVESALMTLVKTDKWDGKEIGKRLFETIVNFQQIKPHSVRNNYLDDVRKALEKNADEINKTIPDSNISYRFGDETKDGVVIDYLHKFTQTGQIKLGFSDAGEHLNRVYQAEYGKTIVPKTIEDKTVFKTQEIIDWAIETIQSSTNDYHKGYAFSILTGRRSIEVFGEKTEYRLGEVGLQVKGIAKKKPIYNNTWFEVFPLADRKMLLDFINSYSLKGNVNKSSLAKLLSRNGIDHKFPTIQKFKDTRDFYASTVIATFRSLNYHNVEQPISDAMAHNSREVIDSYQKFISSPVPTLFESAKHYINLPSKTQ